MLVGVGLCGCGMGVVGVGGVLIGCRGGRWE